MRTRLILLAALISQACLAESPIIIGVRGGVPLNNVISTVQNGGSISSSTDNYVVGPTLGIRLPLGFSVAGDALFTNLTLSSGSTSSLSGSGLNTVNSSTGFSASASSWEFPVLVRFTPGEHHFLAPFVGGGVSVRHLSDFGKIGPYLTNSPNSTSTSVTSNSGVGFVLAGGLQFHAGPLHISPEIRYTHWGSNQISNAFNSVIQTNSNEGQVLVGLTF